MFVMTTEPIPYMSVADVKDYFADKHTEKDLADAYAIAHNKFFGLRTMNMIMKKALLNTRPPVL